MPRKLEILARNFKYPARLPNLMKMELTKRSLPEHVAYRPTTIDLEPNVTCNLACKMCQVPTWDRKAPDLNVDDFGKLLDEIPTLMKIKLQGMGEPFLNNNLLDIIELGVRRDLVIVSNTNGTILNEEICRRVISSGLDTISISIDGATKETYERIRINGKFNLVIENTRRLASMRGGTATPRINVWMLGMRENIHELPMMVQLCHDLGVDGLKLQHDLSYWGKAEWAERLSGETLPDDSNTIRYLKDAAALAAKLGLGFLVFQEDRYSFSEGKNCMWPWTSVYITTDGYVCPCCIAPDPDVVNFGNLHEREFREIWNSEKYRLFRRRLKAGEIPSFCTGCYKDFKEVIDL